MRLSKLLRVCANESTYKKAKEFILGLEGKTIRSGYDFIKFGSNPEVDDGDVHDTVSFAVKFYKHDQLVYEDSVEFEIKTDGSTIIARVDMLGEIFVNKQKNLKPDWSHIFTTLNIRYNNKLKSQSESHLYPVLLRQIKNLIKEMYPGAPVRLKLFENRHNYGYNFGVAAEIPSTPGSFVYFCAVRHDGSINECNVNENGFTKEYLDRQKDHILGRD